MLRSSSVRPPAVARLFYPGHPRVLAEEVSAMLEVAREAPLAPGFPKLVIVPHAGYVYSGPVAASAYGLLGPARGIVRRVVLLGPCHRVPVRGIAFPSATAFETPLGTLPLDAAAIASLRDLPQVVESAATHAEEHALEVQLPFLQRVLGDISLVPLVVGTVEPEKVAEVLDRLWGGDETLIVISSDLSHYHSYEDAQRIDARTVRSILALDTAISHDQACGATPVAGALIAAKRRGLVPRLLDCRSSGDTAGGRDQVVGYAAFSLGPERAAYGRAHGMELLGIARASISSALGNESRRGERRAGEPWLREHRASFVTLTLEGRLRGCVGSLEARRPLAADVAANACAAAFDDSRFARLTRYELDRAEIEVSLLSQPMRVRFESEGELLARLRPGVDGLILELGERRATYLPQVWEDLPDPARFLACLKEKAGVASDRDIRDCRVKRYSVIKWRESELRS